MLTGAIHIWLVTRTQQRPGGCHICFFHFTTLNFRVDAYSTLHSEFHQLSSACLTSCNTMLISHSFPNLTHLLSKLKISRWELLRFFKIQDQWTLEADWLVLGATTLRQKPSIPSVFPQEMIAQIPTGSHKSWPEETISQTTVWSRKISHTYFLHSLLSFFPYIILWLLSVLWKQGLRHPWAPVPPGLSSPK